MFNRKRLEEQNQIIERLKHDRQSLSETVEILTKENASLKTRLNTITKERDALKKQFGQNKPGCRTFNGITLSEEQNKIVDLLENTNSNYFITGKAGTGKSTVLNCFKKTTQKKNVVVAAPTGTAALNVDGATIHSLFRMNLEPQDTWVKSKVNTSASVLETLAKINVLIIDEISMVRADVMDMMDARLKLAKKSNAPFGGCQVIAFGDPYQLPPIARDRTERAFIEDRYGTLFFFGAPEVKRTFQIVELKTVMRQTDQKFIQILNEIREGTITSTNIDLINSRFVVPTLPDQTTRIVLTNADAKRINDQKLAQIDSKEYQYTIKMGGDYPPEKNEIPFDFELHLKVGARIVMTMNDLAKRYVNGSIGTITYLSEDKIRVRIDKQVSEIEPQVYYKRVYRYNKETKQLEVEIAGWAKQYPMRLAWAITIHKSQGQTYDKVIIDYGNSRVFAPGQTYVALSRCKTLDGIYLTRLLSADDVYADKEVFAYMKEIPRTETKSSSKQSGSWREDEMPF